MNFYLLQAFINKLKNEKMSYQITDRSAYRTTVWTIESEKDTYYVTCQEGELYDTWHIVSDMSGEIENDTDLGYELIKMCEFEDTIDI